MRCVPQVHGIVNDTIKFVGGVLTTEMNSALDNPVSCGALSLSFPSSLPPPLIVTIIILSRVGNRLLFPV